MTEDNEDLSILRIGECLWLPKTSSNRMVTPELANGVIIREHAGTARTAGSLAVVAAEVAPPAYWLLHTLRAAAPKRSSWKTGEFATLRLRLIKIAARVVEGTARIRVWLSTACPDAEIFRLLAGRFAAVAP
jgi:hypothetical protein